MKKKQQLEELQEEVERLRATLIKRENECPYCHQQIPRAMCPPQFGSVFMSELRHKTPVQHNW